MTVEQIMKLIEAGYNKEEIAALETSPEAKPEEKPEQKPEQKPEGKPEQKPETSDNSDALREAIERNNKLLEEMKELQKANINGAKMENNENKNSAENIIKSFIEGKREG